MQNSLSHSIVSAKRWLWAILLCGIVCGGITFTITTLMPKIYTAETVLVINIASPGYESGPPSGLVMQPVFNQLIKSDPVLQPVAVKHGLTIAQLKAIVTTKPLPNTPVILIDVDNSDAMLAAQLSYEVTKAFTTYITVQVGSAAHFNVVKPTIPANLSRPQPIQDAFLGSLVGLALALVSIIGLECINAIRTKRI